MSNSKKKENFEHEVKMAKTLGPVSIVFIGIGSLLGGGIFTLLGPTSGLVGPGLVLSMLLGSLLALLNLQMYVALGTTFPAAGGGYVWTRRALGNFQGFIFGWLDWFAHAAACGVYSLSFGYYAVELLRLCGFDVFVGNSMLSTEKIAAVAMIVLFGYVNWRGAKTMGSTGVYVTVLLLVILSFYVISGAVSMSGQTEPFANFSPFLPFGLMGIVAATTFFYIAFEGSEIQVQAGEETKNPSRDIKIGLFSSWAVVSFIYVLISIIIIGATPVAEGVRVWDVLSSFKEGAIIESAKAFMPFGFIVLVFGGLLANLAALNTTIYSSSHVAFALARDKNIWSRFAQIHVKNLTPHASVIASSFLVILMVLTLPLFDVASAASLLFVLLFLLLNIAGIVTHFKFPKTKWAYKIPFFPLTPLLAIAIYILLAFTMLQVNAAAWVITIFWILIGLVNYFSYAQKQSREHFEGEIVYEETLRVVKKTWRRVLLPISADITIAELHDLAEIAFAITSKYNGELIAVKVHEIPQALQLLDGASMIHDQHLFEHLKHWVREYNKKTPNEADINLHSISMVGRNAVDSLLEVIRMEDCDLIIAKWTGSTQTKGAIYGEKIDRLLRESKIDIIVVKNPQPIASILVAEESSGNNPYIPLMGEILDALKKGFNPKMRLISVINPDDSRVDCEDTDCMLSPLALRKEDFEKIEFTRSRSVLTAIVKEAKPKGIDLVVINASSPKFLKEVHLGILPEMLAKHLDTSVIIVRGHEGLTETTLRRWQRRFR